MSHLLRRRGELPPIAPYRELDEGGFDDDIFQVFVDYISPCQISISNDPYEPEPSITDEPNPCNITLYDCSPTLTDTANPYGIIVEFDYEFHYTKGADFNRTLEGLEGSILEHLATATGLVDCPITSGLEIVRDRELQDFPDLFSALSSEPMDERDPRFGGCLVPVESTVLSGSKCDPMTGFLTAYLKPDINPDAGQEAFIRSGIQRFVRDGMNNDIYVTGNVRKVNFLGKRTGEEGGDGVGLTPITKEKDEDDNSNSGGGIGTLGIVLLSVGLAALLALAIFAFVYRKRRKEQEKDNSRHVSFTEPAVASDDLSTNELFRRDEESVGSMEGADIPGSLANTDKLAKTNGDQKEFLKPDAAQVSKHSPSVTAVAPSGSGAAVAPLAPATAVGAASGKPPRRSSKSSSGSRKSSSHSDKGSSSLSSRKNKRRDRERRKKMIPALDAPSLDSIPEEDTDDESQLLAEQTRDMDTSGILGEEESSSTDEEADNDTK